MEMLAGGRVGVEVDGPGFDMVSREDAAVVG